MNDKQNYAIEDIITAIKNKEPIEVEKAFSDVLSDKLKGALDTRKQELAKSVFNPSDESENEDSDDEAEIDEADQFKSSDKNKKSDRKKTKKKRDKWLKTAAGKKYQKNQDKRRDRIEKGTVKPDKKRSKKQKSIAKAYKNER